MYVDAQAEEVAQEVVVVCDLLFALEQVPVHPFAPHVLSLHVFAHVDVHALLHDAEQDVVHAVEQLFPQVLLHEFIQPPEQVVIQVFEQLLPQEEEQEEEQEDVHVVPHDPVQLPSVHPVPEEVVLLQAALPHVPE